MKIGSLFSGVGGLELGLEWAGLGSVVWQVEQDVYCREVLAKHWPSARRYERVEEVGEKNLEAVDLICGGFPCQDISSAGKRVGLGGAQSSLWNEFARIASELRPEWLVVENVASGGKNWVDLVRRDLERIGYASLPIPIAARDVGAPHRRSRIFIVARRQGRVSNGDGLKVRQHEQRAPEGRSRALSNAGDAEPGHRSQDVADGRGHRSGVVGKGNDARECEEQDEAGHKPDRCDARLAHLFPPLRSDLEGWEAYLGAGGPQPGVLPSDDGLPRRVARRRIATLGNAVIPQNAEVIGWIIRHLKEAHDEEPIISEVRARARQDRAPSDARGARAQTTRVAARSVRRPESGAVDQRRKTQRLPVASEERQGDQRDRAPLRSSPKRRAEADEQEASAKGEGESQEAVIVTRRESPKPAGARGTTARREEGKGLRQQPAPAGETPSARPFLKWVGGKTKLLPEILTRLPDKIGTYFEPFLGGGAVFFALAAEGRFKRAILSDANEELTETYRALAYKPLEVIRHLSKHVYEEGYYYTVRASRPGSPDARAARMIYLNRTGFNGLYRVNRKGEFNVPFGRYTNPTICDEERLLAVAAVLRPVNVAIVSVDFEDVVKKAWKGDAVYFDSPYVPFSKTSDFTAYVKGGFDEAAQVRLRDCFKALDARGIHVLLSNSDTPLVRRLYEGFRISQVKAPRRVNSKGGKRGNVNELLISGRN